VRGRLAALEPDIFDALEDLRQVLLTEHEHTLRIEREEHARRARSLEQRLHELERQR
jgi:hypothetical protein